MAIENGPSEDVFPIKHEIFHCHVLPESSHSYIELSKIHRLKNSSDGFCSGNSTQGHSITLFAEIKHRNMVFTDFPCNLPLFGLVS